MKMKLAIVSLLSAFITFAAVAADKPKKAKKQTTLNLYMTAKEAGSAMAKDGKKILFLDVRTRAEVNFLGMPKAADANIPYSLLKGNIDGAYSWNKKKKSFKLAINNDFTAEVERRLKAKGLTKTDTVILMCRSGSRSAKAVNLLAKSGFKKAITVVDGYEGGKAKQGPQKGQRVVNGWKNAGLAWTYKLDATKMYKSN